jgi:proton-translocating NADH-quinone oxidoreductase chain M
MLLAILLIYYETGTTDIEKLLCITFSVEKEILLWFAFFASFAVKVPMVPVHLWLPEAHVEAPTAGSIILAGILLKLGTYGFIRFSIPMFPYASMYFAPYIHVMSVIAIIYVSFTTIRQIDLKKIIAYSSIAHMGFVTLGLFSLTIEGIEGAIILMLSHGFVSPPLFICAGILYDRYKTRLLRNYGGCVLSMPIFAIMFGFFTFANLGMPGTSSYIGESLTLLGIYLNNSFIGVLAATGMIFGAVYSLWVFNRIVYGQMKAHHICKISDVNRRETCLLMLFFLPVLLLGIYPNCLLICLEASVLGIVAV